MSNRTSIDAHDFARGEAVRVRDSRGEQIAYGIVGRTSAAQVEVKSGYSSHWYYARYVERAAQEAPNAA